MELSQNCRYLWLSVQELSINQGGLEPKPSKIKIIFLSKNCYVNLKLTMSGLMVNDTSESNEKIIVGPK